MHSGKKFVFPSCLQLHFPMFFLFDQYLPNYTFEQDRQYTYNVALTRGRATIVALEKKEILHILSVFL
jgi:hypothetical protein